MAHQYGSSRMKRQSAQKKGSYKMTGGIKASKGTKYSGAISKKSGSKNSY